MNQNATPAVPVMKREELISAAESIGMRFPAGQSAAPELVEALAAARQSYPEPSEPEGKWCLIERRHVETLCAAISRQAPAQAVRLTDEQAKGAIVPIAAENPTVYLALCYESGPYDITELRGVAVDIVRAVERAVWAANGLRGE